MAQKVGFQDELFSPSVWWVAFIERDIEHWWDLLSPRWCRHVMCYGYSVHLNCWIVVNPAEPKTVVSAVPDIAFNATLDLLTSGDATIFLVRAQPGEASTNRIFQTCSSIVARVIGLGSAWRPMALVRTLRRIKAEVRHDPNEHQGKRPRGRSRNESAPGGR